MPLSKKRLHDSKLYLILDAEVNSYKEFFGILRRSIPCGVDIVQLRDKNGKTKEIVDAAQALLKFLRPRRIPFILNDRVDVAVAAKADGVHLGQDDLSVSAARRMMGRPAIIGVSCQSLAHAKTAVRGGADYIGFGSVFKTQTKPKRRPMNLNLLRQAAQQIRIPVFAIGGINQENIKIVKAMGITRIAVCRAIGEAPDAGSATRQLAFLLKGE